MTRYVKRILLLLLVMALLVGGMAAYLAITLPSIEELATYKAPLTTRIVTQNGTILAEIGTEKRAYVRIDEIPMSVQEAFISAEDKNFRIHKGFDFYGIGRALRNNTVAVVKGNKLEGASTITQQVAKNFLLSQERTINRKVKEAILTVRIEQVYSKDYILELYLNKIYLGRGAYGVAAAARAYFNKPMEKLTVEELAFLAAIPKAPSKFDPSQNYERAKERRDWVIMRLLDDEKITEKEANQALSRELIVVDKVNNEETGGYAGEEIRKEIISKLPEESFNEGGLYIRSTINSKIQAEAERVLKSALERYDREVGWRGAPVRIFGDKTADEINAINMNTGRTGQKDAIKTGKNTYWHEELQKYKNLNGVRGWQTAIILSTTEQEALLGLRDGSTASLLLKNMDWAAPVPPNGERKKAGQTLKSVKQILQQGDIIYVEKRSGQYYLKQRPEINGAVMVMETHTGRILAMQGGYDFALSKFNRARQAQRQPGSTFKTFVYLAALTQGYTPSSLFLDAPIVGEERENTVERWRPKNYGGTYRGYATLRTGLEKSINLISLRVAQEIGIEPVANLGRQFGIYDTVQQDYTIVLGAQETTLERMTAAFAMIANGGKKITPTLIDLVQNREGKVAYTTQTRQCTGCQNIAWQGQEVPEINDTRAQLVTPDVLYQLTHMLEGVVTRGTGTAARIPNYSIAGKTGTTNESRDVWFIGFSPDIVVGVYLGYDTPKSLGAHATGASLAAPIAAPILYTALRETKSRAAFVAPDNVVYTWVSRENGEVVEEGAADAVLEVFVKGYEPKKVNPQTQAKGMAEKSVLEDITEKGDGIY